MGQQASQNASPGVTMRVIDNSFGTEYRVVPCWEGGVFSRVLAVLFAVFIEQVAGWWIVAAAAAIHLLAWARRLRHESLVVLDGVGIRLESHRLCWPASRTFLEVDRIDAMVLSEVISLSGVKFYLVFKLKGRTRLAVAFRELAPRLEILRDVYRGVHATVFSGGKNAPLVNEGGGNRHVLHLSREA